MLVSKLPSIPRSSVKLTLTGTPTVVDTKSRYCHLTVASGNAYITGEHNAPATTDSFPLIRGIVYDFAGKLSLASDSSGADVRILYYDTI